MGGTWNVFVMAANPAVEENPNTLQVGEEQDSGCCVVL
jgi:hypothetical protein